MLPYRTNIVNAQNPVNYAHPLNRGLAHYYTNLPYWRGELRVRDLGDDRLTGSGWRDRNDGTWQFGGRLEDNFVDASIRPGAWGTWWMNGINEYISLASSFTIPADFSVCFWINSNEVWTTGDTTVLSGASNNYYPYIDETNIQIRGGGGPLQAFSHGGLNTNQWYHVCVQQTGGTSEAFLDGVSLGTNSSRMPIVSELCARDDTSFELHGWFDECRMYDRVLSVYEINELIRLTSVRGSALFNYYEFPIAVEGEEPVAPTLPNNHALIGVGV